MRSSRDGEPRHRPSTPRCIAWSLRYEALRLQWVASSQQFAIQLAVSRPSHSLEIKALSGDDTTASRGIWISSQGRGLVDRLHIPDRCQFSHYHAHPCRTDEIVDVDHTATVNHRQPSRKVFTDLGRRTPYFRKAIFDERQACVAA